jgi:hypothetical protein
VGSGSGAHQGGEVAGFGAGREIAVHEVLGDIVEDGDPDGGGMTLLRREGGERGGGFGGEAAAEAAQVAW